MFYTYHYETQEDLSDHTNGAGNTSESDKPSHTYTHKFNAERLEFETQNCACFHLNIFFVLFQAFRCVSH